MNFAKVQLTTQELLSLPIDELLTRLETSYSGLSSQEAKNVLKYMVIMKLLEKRKKLLLLNFFHILKTL